MLFLCTAFASTWALAVSGSAGCPVPRDVAARALALGVPSQPRGAHEPTAVIDATSAGVRLQLRSPEGQVLAERILAPGPGCDDLAAAAAVIVGTWDAEVRGDSELALRDLAPPPPPPLPALEAKPVWTLAGAGLGASSNGRFGWGGQLEVGRAGADGGSQWTFALYASGPRALDLGAGEAVWQRSGASLGWGWMSHVGRWSADAQVAAGLSYLRLSGRNLPMNQSDSAWDPFAAVHVRAGPRWRRWQPYFAAGLMGYPVARSLRVDASDARSQLSHFEFLAGIGLRCHLR